MIGRLAGTLLQKLPPQVLVDVQGVGYEVEVPMSTFYDLPPLGQPVVLLIQQIIREDVHLLFGFLTAAEREAFRQLIKVSGVGPRMALAVLSGMSVEDLAQAVILQEAGRLTRVPGIGKKTAERLLLELRGRLAEALPSSAAPAQGAHADIVQALAALGYSDKEATAALKSLPPDIGVNEGLKLAFKTLAR